MLPLRLRQRGEGGWTRATRTVPQALLSPRDTRVPSLRSSEKAFLCSLSPLLSVKVMFEQIAQRSSRLGASTDPLHDPLGVPPGEEAAAESGPMGPAVCELGWQVQQVCLKCRNS